MFEGGEQVLDLVIPYIHKGEDRNSVSLVSRKCYSTDSITRKSLTVHVSYNPNPGSLRKRFPFIESLTLKGPSYMFYGLRITPWIQQLALGFRNLKELHLRGRGLTVRDEDLEILASTRGKDLRSLKIKKCQGFSTHGLRHISKYCNQLRTLCLRYCYYGNLKDRTWLHQLALTSMVLERLHVPDISYAEDLTLLAKNCCNSLTSLKIGECHLSKLVDAFRYGVRLEHFSGENLTEARDLVSFQFPPSLNSISIKNLPVTRYTTVLRDLNQISKLKLISLGLYYECQCLLLKCPNLEVLYIEDECGDKGLQVIVQFCKKLRELTHKGLVTHVGLIALAKGCTNLECLKVRLGDISNEAIKCLGTHLKNLRKFRMHLVKKDGTTYPPLDNGIRDMLIGCGKLEWLNISLRHGELTDVGLEYIGKYGGNLRSISLTHIGKSDAGFVKLSEGCPRLRKLKLMDCPFSKQVVTSFVFNMPSLRYVWFRNDCDLDRDRIFLELTRPEFQLGNIGRSKLKRKCPTSDEI